MHPRDDRGVFIVIIAPVFLPGVGRHLKLGGGVILRANGVLNLCGVCFIQHRGVCREFFPGVRGLFIPGGFIIPGSSVFHIVWVRLVLGACGRAVDWNLAHGL